MVREVMKSGFGFIFDPSALVRAKLNLEPEPTTSEIERDSADALEPLHDELQSHILWWVLEIMPFPFSWQNIKRVWQTSYMYVWITWKSWLSTFHPRFYIGQIWAGVGKLLTPTQRCISLSGDAWNHGWNINRRRSGHQTPKSTSIDLQTSSLT